MLAGGMRLPGSETMGFSIQGTIGNMTFMFKLVPTASQVLSGDEVVSIGRCWTLSGFVLQLRNFKFRKSLIL